MVLNNKKGRVLPTFDPHLNQRLIAGTPQINVPNELLHFNKKGEPKLINTLTKTGQITKRDKKPVIKLKGRSFEDGKKNFINVLNDGETLDKNKNKKLYNVFLGLSNVEDKNKNKLRDEYEKIKTSRKKKDIERRKEITKELDFEIGYDKMARKYSRIIDNILI